VSVGKKMPIPDEAAVSLELRWKTIAYQTKAVHDSTIWRRIGESERELRGLEESDQRDLKRAPSLLNDMTHQILELWVILRCSRTGYNPPQGI